MKENIYHLYENQYYYLKYRINLGTKKIQIVYDVHYDFKLSGNIFLLVRMCLNKKDIALF